MAKSRINKMRTQKRVKRKTQKRMNKRKNKIYKKSKKINKYFYSGGSSNRQRPRTRGGSLDDGEVERGFYNGLRVGSIGRKTEKLLVDYLSARGLEYQAARDTVGFIQVEDMLHVFRLIQVVEVRLNINPEINAERHFYEKALAGDTVNMNIYTGDAWPEEEDAYGEAQLLNAEYIGALLTWMDNAAYHDPVTNMARQWAMMVAYDAGALIQGFLPGYNERLGVNSLSSAQAAHRTGDLTSDTVTPYLTFAEKRGQYNDTADKNRLAKERMQEGLKTLLAQNVISLSHGDALSVINQVAGVFGDGVVSQEGKRLLTDAVNAFLDQYPDHKQQIFISKIIHDKVSAGAAAAAVAARAGLRRQAKQRARVLAGLPPEEEGEE